MMCKWEVLAMTAVIYARYSSDNQREESIEGQIRECTAYAEKNGITIVKHYIDRAISAKTVQLPDQHNIKQLLVAVLYHLLELRAIIRLGRDGAVNVVLDDSDVILFGIGRAFTNLAFDGFFALVITGIAGVDHSGHGKHLSLHVIERWSVLSKHCFV